MRSLVKRAPPPPWAPSSLSSAVPLAGAQAFANLKSAMVDYSKGDAEPRIACERLAAFKGKDVSTLQARLVPASDTAPAPCRMSGILEPEIAFEVNLPVCPYPQAARYTGAGRIDEAVDFRCVAAP